MKKVVSILISLCLILSTLTVSVVSVNAETYGDFEYQLLEDNTVEITGYTGDATELEIPSEIDGNTVTSIGDQAFEDCRSLTSITIPNSVTSIGNYAFYYCDSLTTIIIPYSVTSIGDWAFWNCASLTSIEVDDNNSNYCSVDGVLFNKDKTELIQYPAGNTRTSYTIPDSVTSIGDDAFEFCRSLTSITIPDSVTSIGDCAFRYCESLTSITIPDSVTSIGSYAFNNCESLTSITIPDSVTSIGDSAFEYCTSLTSVTIPDSVTSIGSYAFRYCASLTSISVDDNNSNYCSVDGVLFNKNKTELIQCPIGNPRTSYTVPDSVTSIDSHAFDNCQSLISVNIGDSVTSIGNYVFYNCVSLTSVIIGDGVKSIGALVFIYCESLTSVTIGNGVTSIGDRAFLYCSNDLTIYGYANSEAERYASENSLNFHAHIITVDKAVAPNCTETGLTEGKHCSVCGKVLVKQETIKAKGHTLKWITTKSATHFLKGEKVNKCTTCGKVLSRKDIAKKTYTRPSIKGGKKKITVKYKAVSGARGFEVRYKFKGKWKTVKFTTKKAKTVAIKKLKKGKYQVQVRAVKGKLKTNWSKVKKVTVK